MNLPVLPQDKANHVVYGTALTAIGMCYSPVAGAVLCAAFAVGKEVYDWWDNQHGGRHGVELNDALATMSGGAIVLLPWVVKGL